MLSKDLIGLRFSFGRFGQTLFSGTDDTTLKSTRVLSNGPSHFQFELRRFRAEKSSTDRIGLRSRSGRFGQILFSGTNDTMLKYTSSVL